MELLLGNVEQVLERLRLIDEQPVNAQFLEGERIRREVLNEQRAGYGQEIVRTLSGKLTVEFGAGFGRRNLFNMLKFAELFPDLKIVQTLSAQLGWSHFTLLLRVDDSLAREFYGEN